MGVSITNAVAVAVKSKLAEEEVKKSQEREVRKRKFREILEKLWALPVVGRILTDEDGLPKAICDRKIVSQIVVFSRTRRELSLEAKYLRVGFYPDRDIFRA